MSEQNESESVSFSFPAPGVYRDREGKVVRIYCMSCLRDGRSGVKMDYMVKDRVWDEARLAPSNEGGTICIPCLEERLGRKITKDDLKDIRINDGLRGTLG